MTKSEKRWQLLLVADDGRIVPFQHIKGIAITLLILLVLSGVVCAGLAWQLGREKIKHRQTLDQLASIKKEAAHYKSENEVITAELVLADARMEKAGLPVPKRELLTARKDSPPVVVDAPSTADKTVDEQPSASASEKNALPEPEKKPTRESVETADVGRSVATVPPTEPTQSAAPPVVSVSELELEHDPAKGMVKASFRLSNTGPRSSPVAGRCLVVLKRDPVDSNMWKSLPDSALVKGRLEPDQGKDFKISRFIDMDMEADLGTDPSAYDTASVYVFDDAGTVLLEKDFPISLPSLNPDSEPASFRAEPSRTGASVGGDADELAVAVDRFEMRHDTTENILRARFRVSNTGPPSAPVSGRCVVVLKNEQLDPASWLVLPDGPLLDGKPAKGQGQPFRISRFKDMEIEKTVEADPSVFNRAAVYVVGMDGAMLLEKTYPISLPESDNEPENAAPPSPDSADANDTAGPQTDDASVDSSPAPAKAVDSRSSF